MIDAGNPYLDPAEAAALWTWEMVERALVDACALWMRSPGGGRWPFAADGPWHLVTRRVQDGDAVDDVDLRPLPLTKAEVEQRDRVSAWVEVVTNDFDRRVLWAAIRSLAGSHEAVPWTRLRRHLGTTVTTDGLRKRYSRSITTICTMLNARTC